MRRRWLAILVVLAAMVPGVATAASGVRTIKCVSAHYSIQVLSTWQVQHGCSASMTLASPDGDIGMNVRNASWTLGWSNDRAKGFVKLFFADQTATVTQPLKVYTDVIAGRTFIEAEEGTTDGTDQYVDGLLVGYRNKRVYTFFALIKLTGDSATDTRNSTLAATMWRTVRLL